jgi:hypothetical protein
MKPTAEARWPFYFYFYFYLFLFILLLAQYRCEISSSRPTAAKEGQPRNTQCFEFYHSVRSKRQHAPAATKVQKSQVAD